MMTAKPFLNEWQTLLQIIHCTPQLPSVLTNKRISLV